MKANDCRRLLYRGLMYQSPRLWTFYQSPLSTGAHKVIRNPPARIYTCKSIQAVWICRLHVSDHRPSRHGKAPPPSRFVDNPLFLLYSQGYGDPPRDGFRDKHYENEVQIMCKEIASLRGPGRGFWAPMRPGASRSISTGRKRKGQSRIQNFNLDVPGTYSTLDRYIIAGLSRSHLRQIGSRNTV